MKLENMFYYVLNTEKIKIIYRIKDREFYRAREASHNFYDVETHFFFNVWIKKNNKHKGHKFSVHYNINFDNPCGDTVIDLAENMRATMPNDVQYLLDKDFDFKYEDITTFDDRCDNSTKYRVTATSEDETIILYLTHTLHHNNWD